ncbi:MAG: M56 family metallopeptidase [Thermoanaerobaculia bacterium]|nr:M56 family metallopeptidase [Thermoanaerobaculia bacterium]
MNASDLLHDLCFYSLQVGLVLGIGLALPRLLRIHSPSVRLRYWYGLLGLIFLLPLFSGWMPASGAFTPASGVSIGEFLVGSSDLSARTPTIGWPFARWTLVFIGLVIIVRLAWTAIGLFSLAKLRRESRPLPWPTAAASLDAQATKSRVRLFSTPSLATPVTFGLRNPAILLPENFGQLSPPQQEAIVCHELIHIDRRDWLAVLFEEVVQSILWFHPLVWVLLRQIGLAREEVVDREVVRFTQQRRVYLEALVNIAGGSVGNRRGLATTFIHRSDLKRRIHSLLKESPMSKFHLRTSLFATLVVLLLSVAAAGLAFPLLPASGNAPRELTVTDQGVGTVVDSSRSIEGPFQVAGLVVPPERLDGPAPQYTEEARRAELQGIVILSVVIDTEGDVTVQEVLKGLPMGLSENAVEAAAEWKFSPATLNGEPVAVYYNLTFNFRLRDAKPLPSPEAVAMDSSPVQPPVLLSSTTAPYTARARKAGIEGSVVLHLTIDPAGVVTKVVVLRGLPMGLGESAAAAAYDWRFHPATSNGEPIEATLSIEVDFSL